MSGCTWAYACSGQGDGQQLVRRAPTTFPSAIQCFKMSLTAYQMGTGQAVHWSCPQARGLPAARVEKRNWGCDLLCRIHTMHCARAAAMLSLSS